MAGLFPDCEEGAVPPVGKAYGLRSLLDRALLEQPEIFFEAGDHEHLLKMSGQNFQALQAEAEVVEVARHA